MVYDDLINCARRWNIKPSPDVVDAVKKVWCSPANFRSGVIEYYDFVHNVLPRDFKDVKDVFRVFHAKMSENWTKLGDAFRNMDEDHSGTVGRAEIDTLLKKLNINVPPELTEQFAEAMDTDGDGEIDFSEFSAALSRMDPDAPDAQQHDNGVGMLWDADTQHLRKVRQHRPLSAASVHSEAEPDEAAEEAATMKNFINKDGVDRHAGAQVKFENGKFSIDGLEIDLMRLLGEKVYRKKGGIHFVRQTFAHMDKDSSGEISRAEFREFLKPYNLNMTSQAMDALVGIFDDDNDGLIQFEEFTRLVIPTDYTKVKGGGGQMKMVGIPSMVSERARRVVQPLSPRVVAPFEARVCPPAPGDVRATNIIREKVAQRTRNVNDNKAGLQLRDAMRMFDTKKDGTITRADFRKVIEMYNTFLGDDEFEQLANQYDSRQAPGRVEYRPFLQKCLAKNQPSGAFGPHVPPTYLSGGSRPSSSRPSSSRLGSSSRSNMLTGQPLPGPNGTTIMPPLAANRPASSSRVSSPRRALTPRASARQLSKAMYYTPRAVGPMISYRSSKNVTGKVGMPWGQNEASAIASSPRAMATAFTPRATGGL